MQPKKTWIAVADGAVAFVYEHEKMGAGLSKVYGGEFHAVPSHGQDIYSDRPGRAFDPAGQGVHAMEPPTSPQEQARKSLAKDIADWLAAAAYKKKFDQLVLVTSPSMLGLIRGSLPNGMHGLVVCELDKDLTKETPQDIEKALEPVIRL